MNVYIDKCRAHIRVSNKCVECGSLEDIQIAAVNAAASVLCVIKAVMLADGANPAMLRQMTVTDMHDHYHLMAASNSVLDNVGMRQLFNAVRMCEDWYVKGMYDPSFRVAANVITNVTQFVENMCDNLTATKLSPECQMAVATLASMGCGDIPISFILELVEPGVDPMRALPDIIIAWKNKSS